MYRRLALIAVLVFGAACGVTAGPTQARAVVPQAALVAGQRVWVNVSVATLWVRTSSPRPVDAPALRNPVNIRAWLAAMSTSTRRGLVGRVETQALYGEPLLVTGVTSTGWLHVVALNQRTHRDARGYPGWVPARQVTQTRPLPTSTVATVVQRTAWLRDSAGRRVLEVSIGTRLSVLGRTSTMVIVATPTHVRRYVYASVVVVRSTTAPARAKTAAGVVGTARGFIGVPYLWGGRSGFAVDCSGFTQLVYRLHGVSIPRDTGDQARAGRAVSLSALGPADLLFYRASATAAISHVALFIGSGQRVHAPYTGAYVRINGIGAPVLARRYL